MKNENHSAVERPNATIGAGSHEEQCVELKAFWELRRRRLARLYERLATDLAQIGDHRIEKLFRSLAADTVKGRDEAHRRRAGSAVEPSSLLAEWSGCDTSEPVVVATDFRTPYEVWAFAVQNDERLFQEFVCVACGVNDAFLRVESILLAQSALDDADRHRVRRRLAFHAERLKNDSGRFPNINRIGALDDFVHVALAVERWFCKFVAATSLSEDFKNIITHSTLDEITRLEAMVGAILPSRRLERQLNRLDESKSRWTRVQHEPAQDFIRVTMHAERIFDYYDSIFESAEDETVMVEAQSLSAAAIRRLQAIQHACNFCISTGGIRVMPDRSGC
jgi:hypothetical protein